MSDQLGLLTRVRDFLQDVDRPRVAGVLPALLADVELARREASEAKADADVLKHLAEHPGTVLGADDVDAIINQMAEDRDRLKAELADCAAASPPSPEPTLAVMELLHDADVFTAKCPDARMDEGAQGALEELLDSMAWVAGLYGKSKSAETSAMTYAQFADKVRRDMTAPGARPPEPAAAAPEAGWRPMEATRPRVVGVCYQERRWLHADGRTEWLPDVADGSGGDGWRPTGEVRWLDSAGGGRFPVRLWVADGGRAEWRRERTPPAATVPAGEALGRAVAALEEADERPEPLTGFDREILALIRDADRVGRSCLEHGAHIGAGQAAAIEDMYESIDDISDTFRNKGYPLEGKYWEAVNKILVRCRPEDTHDCDIPRDADDPMCEDPAPGVDPKDEWAPTDRTQAMTNVAGSGWLEREWRHPDGRTEWRHDCGKRPADPASGGDPGGWLAAAGMVGAVPPAAEAERAKVVQELAGGGEVKQPGLRWLMRHNGVREVRILQWLGGDGWTDVPTEWPQGHKRSA